MEQIHERNREYWLNRAPGYSEVNQEELSGIQKQTWSKLLDREITDHFGRNHKNKKEIKVLDIGAGPGFISIILTELGYSVTAADFAETMLEEAKKNAGKLEAEITFKQEDAMNLSFADDSFDVVISRNLTWNLPDPEAAYRQWLRVLRKNGMLLVFDANWYAFLWDEQKKQEYEADRQNVADIGFDDYNIGENFDVMDEIAGELPLTRMKRPYWDEELFKSMGVSSVSFVEDIGSEVYSEKEKVNYASTPLFMVKVVK